MRRSSTSIAQIDAQADGGRACAAPTAAKPDESLSAHLQLHGRSRHRIGHATPADAPIHPNDSIRSNARGKYSTQRFTTRRLKALNQQAAGTTAAGVWPHCRIPGYRVDGRRMCWCRGAAHAGCTTLSGGDEAEPRSRRHLVAAMAIDRFTAEVVKPAPRPTRTRRSSIRASSTRCKPLSSRRSTCRSTPERQGSPRAAGRRRSELVCADRCGRAFTGARVAAMELPARRSVESDDASAPDDLPCDDGGGDQRRMGVVARAGVCARAGAGRENAQGVRPQHVVAWSPSQTIAPCGWSDVCVVTLADGTGSSRAQHVRA
jgi:hypothetical protein